MRQTEKKYTYEIQNVYYYLRVSVGNMSNVYKCLRKAIVSKNKFRLIYKNKQFFHILQKIKIS